ncbi:MAG: hypothetical protein ACE5FS_09590 [Paracoccaceae bacterium]
MNEHEARLALARALWRVENADNLPETSEAISEAFLAVKEEMLVKAIKVMRHLRNQKVILAADQ